MKKSIRVLIADDSQIVVQRLRNILSELDFVDSIGHARDGQEALLLLEFMNPDVILLDLKMPVKSGVQVLDEIRTSGKSLTVIMITSYTDEFFREHLLNKGANYFLDKISEFEKIPELLQNEFLKLTGS